MEQPLPSELARRWANLPDLTYRGNGEWSAACPTCGGGGQRHDKSDRFRMFASDSHHNARGWCRQCGYFAWADDDQRRPTHEEIEAATRERLRLVEAENQRIKAKLQRIADADFWRRWHDDMGEERRDLWRREGIPDYFIDYYALGYAADYTCYYDGREWHTAAMTIPHYGPGWKLTNIQYRLLNPPEPGDKYRQTAGLPAALFLTEPDTPLAGAVLLTEGAKKAIVTYANLGERPGGTKMAMASIPSKTPSHTLLDRLADAEPVFLCLDPDAYSSTKGVPAANRIAVALGRGRVRIVRLPVKADDFFTRYNGTQRDFMNHIRQAIRA